MRTKFYTRLHIEILRQGRSFADLSRETGIHAQTILDYAHDRPCNEGGRPKHRRVPRHHATLLAKALDVHPDLVMDREPYTIEPAIRVVATTI